MSARCLGVQTFARIDVARKLLFLAVAQIPAAVWFLSPNQVDGNTFSRSATFLLNALKTQSEWELRIKEPDVPLVRRP
jgi:hypothetical protein